MATSTDAVSAFAASLDSFAPNRVARYAPGDEDIAFDVLFCGCVVARFFQKHRR
jgi:hypothetical protein